MIKKGHLNLDEKGKTGRFDFPIDIFLHSLAEYACNNAVGVILSGAGSDGILGLRSIKSGGGLTVVQDEESARFSGMPTSAISTHMVDVIAPPEEMWKILSNYRDHLKGSPMEIPERLYQSESDVFKSIIQTVKDHSNHNFSGYRQNTLYRRIEKRMGINQISRMGDYLILLRGSRSEAETLSAELLIGVTQYFRDPKTWEQLR